MLLLRTGELRQPPTRDPIHSGTQSAHEGGEESVVDGNPSSERECCGCHDNSMPRRVLPDRNLCGGRHSSQARDDAQSK
eukprot:13775057-Alexandrium_andersonii.AAC.1